MRFLSNKQPVPRVPLIRGGEGEGIGIFYLGPENIVVLKGLCYAI